MSPVDFGRLPFAERPDLTPYLIHLTRESEDEDGYSALDNLLRILEHGEIWGSSTDKGFIIGRRRAVCFMDIPFIALKYVCSRKNQNRYEPYGVVVGKKYAYAQGARPVLYLSKEERRRLGIPASELWRVVTFEVTKAGWISWLHEREWRCPGNFNLPRLPKTVRAVLVKTTADAVRLQAEIEARRGNLRSVPRSVIPLEVICQGLDY